MNITTKKFASGKYFIHLDGDRIPGCIIGGQHRFMLEIGAKSYGPFKSITAAADIAASLHKHKEIVSGSK